MPTVYDDCLYLFDGMQRIYFGGFNSLFQLGMQFIKFPPHSPVSTLVAMLGFAIFGPNLVGPYAINIFFLIAYAFVVYLLAREYLDRWESATIGAFMVYAPVAHALITDIYPDMASAVVFGAALYLLLRHAKSDLSPSKLMAVGACAAFAVVVKPSAIIVILPMVGLAGVIGAYRPFEQPPMPIAQAHRRVLYAAGGAMIVLIPFLAIWGHDIWEYDYYVLISHRDLWISHGSRMFHILYNSVGVGGAMGLAHFFYIGILFILIDVAASLRNGRNTQTYGVLAFYVVTTVTYAGIIASGEKDIHQGSFFYFPFLFCATIAISRMAQRLGSLHPHLQGAIPVFLLLTAVLFFKPATFYGYEKPTPRLMEQSHREQDAIVAAIVQNLVDPANANCGTFKLGIIGGPFISGQGIALQVLFDHHILVEPLDFSDVASIDDLKERTKAVRFLVFPKDDPNFQSNTTLSIAPQFLDVMAGDTDWRRTNIFGRDVFIRRRC